MSDSIYITVLVALLTGGTGAAILDWIRQRRRDKASGDMAILEVIEKLKLRIKALEDELEGYRVTLAELRKELDLKEQCILDLEQELSEFRRQLRTLEDNSSNSKRHAH